MPFRVVIFVVFCSFRLPTQALFLDRIKKRTTMKNYLLLFCLLFITSSLFGQKGDDRDEDSSTPVISISTDDNDGPSQMITTYPTLDIEALPITDYQGPGSFKLAFTYLHAGPAWSTAKFDLQIGDLSNPNNDFRWTADQLIQEFNSQVMFDDNGVEYFFDNVSVVPKNAGSNSMPDTEFEVTIQINHFIGGTGGTLKIAVVGYPIGPIWPIQTRILPEFVEGAPPAEPGCGGLFVGVELLETADVIGNIFPIAEGVYESEAEGMICGCDDLQACNYDMGAEFNDGSCTDRCGCMDRDAKNYDPDAIYDDGSYCIYPDGYTPSPNGNKLSENISQIDIYPNPTTGLVNFKVTDEVHSIQIYDNEARLVYEFEGNVFGQVDISTLPSGIYQLRTFLTSGKVNIAKIVLLK